MTQVHPEYIELAEVVEWSDVIVIALPADPPHRIELVSILPPGSVFAGKNEPPFHDGFEYDPEMAEAGRLDRNYPPYSRYWGRFTVREVLKGAAPGAGAIIESRGADDGTHLGGHRLYYIQGIGESPICETYASTDPPGPGDPHILFLRTLADGAGYEFVAAGSVEGLARRADVEALIATA